MHEYSSGTVYLCKAYVLNSARVPMELTGSVSDAKTRVLRRCA